MYSSREGIRQHHSAFELFQKRITLCSWVIKEGASNDLPLWTGYTDRRTRGGGGEAGKNWERLRGGHKPIMHGMKNEGKTGPARGKDDTQDVPRKRA